VSQGQNGTGQDAPFLPTDRDSIIDYLKRVGCPVNEATIAYETRVTELENEGLTRSDAQGIADMEGL